MRGRLALILGALVLSPLGRAAAEGPTVVRDVLPGGLRLLVRDDPNAQVVTVSLQVNVGARYDTPETPGLSNLVQRVMIRGTARRSARQIIQAAEDIGGSLEASADVEHAEIRGGGSRFTPARCSPSSPRSPCRPRLRQTRWNASDAWS